MKLSIGDERLVATLADRELRLILGVTQKTGRPLTMRQEETVDALRRIFVAARGGLCK